MPAEKLSPPQDKLVLVVDDDEGARDLFKFSLGKDGFRVDTAEDGQQALDKIRSLRPDAVILDLILPRFGGFEVLRRLQSEDAAKIPIIIVSGRRADAGMADMLRHESNVKEFFEKPIQMGTLRSTLHQVLGTLAPDDAPKDE